MRGGGERKEKEERKETFSPPDKPIGDLSFAHFTANFPERRGPGRGRIPEGFSPFNDPPPPFRRDVTGTSGKSTAERKEKQAIFIGSKGEREGGGPLPPLFLELC